MTDVNEIREGSGLTLHFREFVNVPCLEMLDDLRAAIPKQRCILIC